MMFLNPGLGRRTYQLILLSLVAGTAIAALGIYKGVDLGGLAFVVFAVTAPITGAAAGNNIGTSFADAKAKSNGGADAPK